MFTRNLAIWSVCSILLFSCTSTEDDYVEIIHTNFKEEVPLGFSFEFTFDQNLVTDTLLNNWMESSIIAFEPEIKGKFFWKHPNVLVFSPSTYLPPATAYKAKVNKDEFAENTKIKEQDFSFHTPWLKLLKVDNYWDTENGGSQAKLFTEVHFNYPVAAESVSKKINVEMDDKTKALKMITQGEATIIKFIVPDIAPKDEDQKAKMVIDQSLSPAVGGLSWTENKNYDLRIASPFKLNITSVTPSHDGTNGSITVACSQNINTSNIKDHVDINPKVKYEIVEGNNQFVIQSSELNIKNKYTITIKKGLKGLLGGELKTDDQRDISFGELEPSIKFLNRKDLYLSEKGNRNIEVSIINIEEVKLQVFKVYTNNLLDYMGGRDHYYYDDYYYDDYYSGDNGRVRDNGDLVYEEEIETKELAINGNKRVLNFNIDDKLRSYEGLYLIKLTSSKDRWRSAAKMVALSDIGLIVKEGKESVSVFVNSILTAQPISGTEITIIGRNNQKIRSSSTDANGVAVIPLSKQDISGFKPQLVTASKGEDFNFIHLSKTEINTSRFEVGGMRKNETGWMAFIYEDRDLFRPGETAHVSAIVRDFEWNIPEPVPVIIKVNSPDGKEHKTYKKTLDKQGALEVSIPFSTDAMTGGYSVSLLTSNEVHLSSTYLKVEEFVPDRIRVKTVLDKEEFKNGDTLTISLNAENLFGPPASDRNYEVQLSLRRSYFSSKEFSDYIFSLSSDRNSFDNRIEKGKTDEKGNGNANFIVPNVYSNMGRLHAQINTTVFDETGRPVNRINTGTVYTQDTFFGIRSGSYYSKVNRKAQINIVGVDTEGKLRSGAEAEVTLIRHEYRTVLSKSGNYFRYRSQHEEKTIEKKNIQIGNTPFEYAFTPDVSGRYEVRVAIPGSSNYVSRTLYCYGWGSTTRNSFRVNNEGKIDIVLDKDSYSVGDRAKVLMKTPFSGKVLITIEADDVVQYFYQSTDQKALSFDLDITEEFLPNIYITATLFRPHKESELPLTVAHGFAPIKVDDPKRDIAVKIEAVEKSRSNTKQKIKIKGAPNSQVTVSVVDEGILQVSGFETPDPYDFFYQKRALGVSSHNIYPFLFPEVTLQNGKPGGGAALKKRVNPMTNKRFELVSFWSGILKTDQNGYASMDINIPQFSGELRIMAVDYKNNYFGSAQKAMKVADPIVISPGIPRFLSPRDTITAIFTVTNTTEENASIKSFIELDGALKVAGETTQDEVINGKTEKRIFYKIVSEPTIGTGSITLHVEGLGEKFTNKTNISIRPASPLQKRSGSGVIEENSTVAVDLETENFMTPSIGRKLIVGNSPMIEFRKDLDYLVRYPHGCLEQTVSKAFPQIYIDDILKDAMGDEYKEGEARRNVQHAIEKLKTMQLYNGGFTYWPGLGRENWWASAYATHFLMEAKKAGYEVDDNFIEPAIDHLSEKVKNKEKVDYYYNGRLNRRIAPKTIAYGLYILALADQPDRSTMNYYKAHLSDLSLDSHYLLASAYLIIGDEKSYREILPGTFEGEIANSVFGGTMHSYIRDEAIALNALLEADPSNSQIPTMARHIAEQLKTKRWLNTQERSFSLLALGKIAKETSKSSVQASIKSGGKEIGKLDGRVMTLRSDKIKSDNVEITTTGSGVLYYFWETEGIDKTGAYKEEDSFLAVRKKFYRRDGTLISNNKLKQNDMVIVKISIKSLQNNFVENVAITDILPAGLEIENPRLKNVPGVNWIKDRSYPEYMDIRDDRITYFVTSSGKEKHFYYMARAVTPGYYQMGPVGADAMYNGEYHSYSGGGTLIVEE
ncbi:MAG: alpha-2-macroglobulin family protein [Flavobacteriales bacterium]|nr:alpha-2-macroglobulin family protein [Flavobacteriales bacterium]